MMIINLCISRSLIFHFPCRLILNQWIWAYKESCNISHLEGRINTFNIGHIELDVNVILFMTCLYIRYVRRTATEIFSHRNFCRRNFFLTEIFEKTFLSFFLSFFFAEELRFESDDNCDLKLRDDSDKDRGFLSRC